ncbi:MAG: histidine ammonia-lyase [Planctomycetota bacterium]
MSGVRLDGGSVSITQCCDVARLGSPVSLGGGAVDRVRASRRRVEDVLAAGDVHYGINTGFGSLSRQVIPADQLGALQLNLVRSHAAGVGEPHAVETVRAAMFLAAASLSRGASGVRLELVEALIGVLNAGVTPVVPAIGSVGASGDLAPLAHVGLVLVGEGLADTPNGRMGGREALASAGLKPIKLEAKEGLALLNGTHFMAAEGALLAADWQQLFDAALIACAMSYDAYRATDSCLDGRVLEHRGHAGPVDVADAMRELLADSEILASHREGDSRVQDPYSLRCVPQVLGAALDCWRYVKQSVDRELAAVSDNPLVFDAVGGTAGVDVVSAGNFHGMPIALPLDALASATAHVAGISERRVFLLLAAREPESMLRPYLADQPGVESGLMIAQYTAAACCNELVGLASSATAANIPTSAGVEDYNSFGPRAAAKARRGIDLARRVVAIELLCAAEGVECHRPLRSSAVVENAHAAVRSVAPDAPGDRPPSPEIEAIAEQIGRGTYTTGRAW